MSLEEISKELANLKAELAHIREVGEKRKAELREHKNKRKIEVTSRVSRLGPPLRFTRLPLLPSLPLPLLPSLFLFWFRDFFWMQTYRKSLLVYACIKTCLSPSGLLVDALCVVFLPQACSLMLCVLKHVFLLKVRRLRDEAEEQKPKIGSLIIDQTRKMCVKEIRRYHRGNDNRGYKR